MLPRANGLKPPGSLPTPGVGQVGLGSRALASGPGAIVKGRAMVLGPA
jgi:hypothetical protein